jgi:hypothetical protein
VVVVAVAAAADVVVAAVVAVAIALAGWDSNNPEGVAYIRIGVHKAESVSTPLESLQCNIEAQRRSEEGTQDTPFRSAGVAAAVVVVVAVD